MQSAIAICNVALTTYIGAATITSLDGPSPEAQNCDLHYERVRRSLLQRFPWYWASRREVLVEETLNDRAGAWAHKYARPAHLVAIRWVNHPAAARMSLEAGRSPDSLRELTATAIYSDMADAVIEYTRDETDPTLFPPAFADALAASIGAAIAMAITKDVAKKKDAEQAAALLLDQAMAMDYNERPAVEQRHIPPNLAVRGIV